MHLLNKCETCDKNIKREQCGKKNRFALSFSAFSDILCSRKEWYDCYRNRDIEALRLQWYSIRLKARKAHTVSGRISLGVSRITLRSNRTRHRRLPTEFFPKFWFVGVLILDKRFKLPPRLPNARHSHTVGEVLAPPDLKHLFLL